MFHPFVIVFVAALRATAPTAPVHGASITTDDARAPDTRSAVKELRTKADAAERESLRGRHGSGPRERDVERALPRF